MEPGVYVGEGGKVAKPREEEKRILKGEEPAHTHSLSGPGI